MSIKRLDRRHKHKAVIVRVQIRVWSCQTATILWRSRSRLCIRTLTHAATSSSVLIGLRSSTRVPSGRGMRTRNPMSRLLTTRTTTARWSTRAACVDEHWPRRLQTNNCLERQLGWRCPRRMTLTKVRCWRSVKICRPSIYEQVRSDCRRDGLTAVDLVVSADF